MKNHSNREVSISDTIFFFARESECFATNADLIATDTDLIARESECFARYKKSSRRNESASGENRNALRRILRWRKVGERHFALDYVEIKWCEAKKGEILYCLRSII